MNNLPIDDRGGSEYPNRRPWLWVVVAVVIVGVGTQRYFSYRAKHGSQPAAVPAAAVTPAPVQAAPAVGKVPVPASTDIKPAAQTADATTNTPVVTNALPAVRGTNEVLALLVEAQQLLDKSDFAGARSKLHEVLKQTTDPRLLADAEERIGKINVETSLTPQPMPGKVDYVVQPGDSIEKIAKKFGTTIDLVQEGNQLKNPDLIKAGDRLIVLTGKVSIVVSKARNDLLVRMGDQFFKRYRVGTGKYSKTPVGTFVVNDRQKEPVWWRPDGKEIPFGDKENILGTRWMSIRATGSTPGVKGYGIHGTWDETSIGKSESAGCIRMKNSDVEELYKFISVNTPVLITE